MDCGRFSLRKNVRKGQVGPRRELTLHRDIRLGLSGLAMALTACARLAGLEPPDGDKHRAAGGSEIPADQLPRDGTLPPAPRKDCGDTRSNPESCGFCDHSCIGTTCTEGRCAEETLL